MADEKPARAEAKPKRAPKKKAAPKAARGAKGAKGTPGTLRIRYMRSAIGAPESHKLVVKSLGFKRLNQVVVRQDTPAVRGMVARIPHLVTILEAERG